MFFLLRYFLLYGRSRAVWRRINAFLSAGFTGLVFERKCTGKNATFVCLALSEWRLHYSEMKGGKIEKGDNLSSKFGGGNALTDREGLPGSS